MFKYRIALEVTAGNSAVKVGMCPCKIETKLQLLIQRLVDGIIWKYGNMNALLYPIHSP